MLKRNAYFCFFGLQVKDVPEPYVEVKATIFKRRCEIPEQSLQQAKEAGTEDLGPEDTDLSTVGDGEDGHHDDHHENEAGGELSAPSTTGRTTRLRARQTRRFGRVELLQQRQLFNTRVTESLPAMYIRGKCYVDTLLAGNIDRGEHYLEFNDTFFYTNCYDPDDHEVYKRKRGDIRIGAAFQADVSAVAKLSSSAELMEMDSSGSAEKPIVVSSAGETNREPETDTPVGSSRRTVGGGGYALRQRGQKRALLDDTGSGKRTGMESVKMDDESDTLKQVCTLDCATN